MVVLLAHQSRVFTLTVYSGPNIDGSPDLAFLGNVPLAGLYWVVNRITRTGRVLTVTLPCMAFFRAGGSIVSREQKSNKETKKKAALTPKEKKAAKKDKKTTKGFLH